MLLLQTPAMGIDRLVVGHRTVLAVTGELSDTTFMDSAGLHLLLGLQRRTAELSRRLAIICPAGCARRVLELTRLVGVLPVYGDRGAAHRDA